MEIPIPDLERAAAAGWRAPEEIPLGSWLLRAAGGFTGRANSALAIGDPGLPLAAAIGKVRQWYQARGLPAMVAASFPLGQPQRSGIDRFLHEQGWFIRSGPATVMTAAPGAIARRSASAAVHIEVAAEPDDGWLALYRYRGQPPPPVSRRLLVSAPWQAFASVRESGEVLAIGRLAAAGEWAGFTAFEVDPARRRRGLASAIIAALAGLARDRGISGLYLQVENDNAAARSLYRQAGFADHHGYHYRVAP
jgi:ribosomal protein S18 acetylase RimI-like enzyme